MNKNVRLALVLDEAEAKLGKNHLARPTLATALKREHCWEIS